MPHVILEYSANLAHLVSIDGVVGAVHESVLATGLVSLDALRTRALECQHYAIADRHADNAFVAVTVRLGPGRSVGDRQQLMTAVLDAVDRSLGGRRQTVMLSIECHEIDPALRINRNHLRPLVAARNAGSEPEE